MDEEEPKGQERGAWSCLGVVFVFQVAVLLVIQCQGGVGFLELNMWRMG